MTGYCRQRCWWSSRGAAVSLLLVILFVSACNSEEAVGDSFAETDNVHIISIDFENFINGLPEGMEAIVSATTGDTEETNLIEQDSTVFHSGCSSMRITGSEETANWQWVSVQIPDGVRCVTVRFFARGENLAQEADQYNNCHAGLWYQDMIGNTGSKLAWFPMGTSDWEEYTVSLDVEANMADSVKFLIFSSISGSLWIDDLTVTCNDESTMPRSAEIPEAYSEYINDLSKVTSFMELAPAGTGECPVTISSDEALEDIEMLRYLFENGYSGYEYWHNRGVDFGGVYERLIELAEENEDVSVFVMEGIIADGLSSIQDGHLTVSGHSTSRFLKRKTPYLTDVIVERELLENGEADPSADYTVVLSAVDTVHPGMVYAGPEDNLFPIFSRSGVEQFLLGVFSDEIESRAVFPFQTGSSVAASIELPLHQCRLGRTALPGEESFYRTEVDGIELVRIADFGADNHELMLEFAESGSDLADTDKLIVDLMGNSGGSSRYGKGFIEGLNRVAHWRMYYAMLCSPATIGSYAATETEDMPEEVAASITRMQQSLERLRETPVRCWLYLNDEIRSREMGDYQGRAVFLTDRYVASSGEALLDYSKSVPNAVLVGENSAGVGTFGEVRQYWLPNSHISLYLPSKLFLAPGFEEGVGYLPDYWLDSPDPVAEVARWLNNPDSYQFVFPPPPVLHHMGFEEFPHDLPLHMEVRWGATSGTGQQHSDISRDSEIKTEGSSSLRLEGTSETDIWNSLYASVPQGIEVLNVTYDVRGENIQCEGNQFDNCYVGFIYIDSNSRKQFEINRYSDSFHWHQDSLQLNIEELNASGIEFCIFLSKSGKLWVDNVQFMER